MKQNSKRLTSAIIAVLFLIAALIVYFEMIAPSYDNLQTDKAQEISEQALYSNEQQIVTQVKKLIATYQSEATTTQSVNMALPVGPSVSGALAQIYGIAANTGFSVESAGITVQTIQAPTPAAAINSSSTYIGSVATTGGSIVRPSGTVSFQLQGTGSYESFKSFLLGLENNIRLFNVTAASIQPAASVASKLGISNQDQFNYTVTVVTYYQSS